MLSAEEVVQIVSEANRLSDELRAYFDLADEPACSHPPADEAALAELQLMYPNQIPPSFIRFLSLFDGVDNFEWVDVSILPVKRLLRTSILENIWVDCEKWSRGDIWIFGHSDYDSHILGFCQQTPPVNGERLVLEFDVHGKLREFQDFDSYLLDRLHRYHEEVKAERTNRANLEDD